MAIDGDKLLLTNHYKDSSKMQESDLLIINKYNKSLVKKIKFPKGFNHVSGLSLTGHKFHFVDFGHEGIFELDIVNESLKVREVMKLPIKGVSSISTYDQYAAVSFHILPHRYPYLKNRKIKFFNLSTGEEVQIKGEILESNKSQGLTFFKKRVMTFTSLNQ